MLPGLWNAVDPRQDEPGQCHEIPGRRLAQREQPRDVADRHRAIDQQRAVVALGDLGLDGALIFGRSPATASSRSVRVAIPWTEPYSSTTSAVCTGVFLNRSSVRRIEVASGTINGACIACSTSRGRVSIERVRLWARESIRKRGLDSPSVFVTVQ